MVSKAKANPTQSSQPKSLWQMYQEEQARPLGYRRKESFEDFKERIFKSLKNEPLPKDEPVSSMMEQAMRLPNSGPGVAVPVSLDVLPEYLGLHGLEPVETKLPANKPLVLRVVRHKKQVGG